MLNISWTYLLLYYMQEPSFNQNDTKTSVLLQKYNAHYLAATAWDSIEFYYRQNQQTNYTEGTEGGLIKHYIQQSYVNLR